MCEKCAKTAKPTHNIHIIGMHPRNHCKLELWLFYFKPTCLYCHQLKVENINQLNATITSRKISKTFLGHSAQYYCLLCLQTES